MSIFFSEAPSLIRIPTFASPSQPKQAQANPQTREEARLMRLKGPAAQWANFGALLQPTSQELPTNLFAKASTSAAVNPAQISSRTVLEARTPKKKKSTTPAVKASASAKKQGKAKSSTSTAARASNLKEKGKAKAKELVKEAGKKLLGGLRGSKSLEEQDPPAKKKRAEAKRSPPPPPSMSALSSPVKAPTPPRSPPKKRAKPRTASVGNPPANKSTSGGARAGDAKVVEASDTGGKGEAVETLEKASATSRGRGGVRGVKRKAIVEVDDVLDEGSRPTLMDLKAAKDYEPASKPAKKTTKRQRTSPLPTSPAFVASTEDAEPKESRPAPAKPITKHKPPREKASTVAQGPSARPMSDSTLTPMSVVWASVEEVIETKKSETTDPFVKTILTKYKSTLQAEFDFHSDLISQFEARSSALEEAKTSTSDLRRQASDLKLSRKDVKNQGSKSKKVVEETKKVEVKQQSDNATVRIKGKKAAEPVEEDAHVPKSNAAAALLARIAKVNQQLSLLGGSR